MVRLQLVNTARAVRVPRSRLLISFSRITSVNNMEKKREGSEAAGSAKRTKSENGKASKPSPSPNKEAIPVPDLEECGFNLEQLPQVCYCFFINFSTHSSIWILTLSQVLSIDALSAAVLV